MAKKTAKKTAKKSTPKLPLADLRYILRTLGLGRYVTYTKVHDDKSITMSLKSPIPQASLDILKKRYKVLANRRSMFIDKLEDSLSPSLPTSAPKTPAEHLEHILHTLGLGQYVDSTNIRPDDCIEMILKRPVLKKSLAALRERYWVSGDGRSLLINERKHRAESKPSPKT